MFVIVSWVSFLINPHVVPGRMGLLVTLFLVLINIFNSVRLVNNDLSEEDHYSWYLIYKQSFSHHAESKRQYLLASTPLIFISSFASFLYLVSPRSSSFSFLHRLLYQELWWSMLWYCSCSRKDGNPSEQLTKDWNTSSQAKRVTGRWRSLYAVPPTEKITIHRWYRIRFLGLSTTLLLNRKPLKTTFTFLSRISVYTFILLVYAVAYYGTVIC